MTREQTMRPVAADDDLRVHDAGVAAGGDESLCVAGAADSAATLLLAGSARAGERVTATAGARISLPAGVSAATAFLIPAVATSLQVWDALELEIGCAAVLTDGAWAPLLREVSTWYGAVPVAAALPAGAGDADIAATLARELARFPRVCAVETSGRAGQVDLLLEAIPRQTRLLFAGRSADRLTIDYYINVHRKGLHLFSRALAPLSLLDRASAPLLQRAADLLADGERARRCGQSVTALDGR